MSDVKAPRTGDPDDRHTLGELRGALARGDVLELHGSDGSATIRVPDDLRDLLADVVHDLDTDDGLRADGGRDVRSSGETEREVRTKIVSSLSRGLPYRAWCPDCGERFKAGIPGDAERAARSHGCSTDTETDRGGDA